MPTRTKLFVALAIIPGLVMLSLGVPHWESANPVRFTIYLLLAIVASTLKIQLRNITGSLIQACLAPVPFPRRSRLGKL